MRPAPELSEQRLALVVATATYTDPGLRQLRSPAADAADIADVLAAPDIGGFTVTQVINRPEYEIRRSIDSFLADRTLDDLVLIYLSCHGVLDARGRLYFAATDTTKPHLASTAVESTWLLDRLEECRARRQVLILDCCFSGAFADTKGDTEVDLQRRLIGAGRGRAVLTASRAGEYSYEGKPLANGTQGSVFTAGLVEGLRTGKADDDGDGYITVEDAYTYAATHVQAHGGTQTPQRWLFGGEDAIVLARNPKGAIVKAAPLPDALRFSLDSPYPDVRKGAVQTLGTWLTSTDSGKVLAAQQTLHLVASQDSPPVAAEARKLLDTSSSPAEPKPPVLARAPIGVAYQHFVTIDKAGSGLSRRINDLAFSPDGVLLAGAGADSTVHLWHSATGEPVVEPFRGHRDSVCSVAFSPDGQLLASGSTDNTVQLWDPATGEPIGLAMKGHTGSVFRVAFSPDGRQLASCSEDKTVQLWDPATGERMGLALEGHGKGVASVAFSPHGRLLASAGQDSIIRLWDLNTGQSIGNPLRGHTQTVYRVAFSPDGRLLASVAGDGTVRLWDPATGQPGGRTLQGSSRGWVDALAFRPDGRVLAAGGEDRAVRFWDPATGRTAGRPLVCLSSVMAVAFSPDGLLLASSGNDETVWIWAADQ